MSGLNKLKEGVKAVETQLNFYINDIVKKDKRITELEGAIREHKTAVTGHKPVTSLDYDSKLWQVLEKGE